MTLTRKPVSLPLSPSLTPANHAPPIVVKPSSAPDDPLRPWFEQLQPD